MTIRAAKFTPEVLLSAPRRSVGNPNSTGKLVLYTTSTYSFEEHKKTGEIRVLDVASGHSTKLYRDGSYSEPTWISETEFLLLKTGEKGTSSLMVADVTSPGGVPTEISKFPGAISNLKVKQLDEHTIALACSALVSPDDKIYNPDAEKKPLSSAKVYTSLFARHWDAWVSENRNAIFYGTLKKSPSSAVCSDGARTYPAPPVYTLAAPGLTNILAGTGLQSPVPPFGGASDFDLAATGIVFVARDPSLSPATHTKSDLYFTPLPALTTTTTTSAPAPRPQLVKTGKLRGYAGAPTFSHSGKSVAFTRMRNDQYESDKTRLLLLPSVFDLANVQEFYASDDGEGGWDRRPDAVVWSEDDSELFVVAEDLGRSKVFRLPASPSDAAAQGLPEVVSDIEGNVSDVRLFGTGHGSGKGKAKLFVSASSLVDSSFYSTLDTSSKSLRLLSSNTKSGSTFGLSRSQVSELWIPGDGGSHDYDVHAWVVKPSNFSPDKRYPLALLIHGGPQSAWADSWSTRWNPAVFAEQGYIVVAPNPTGSTGYGMALQNGIRESWGGRPYEDLERVWEFLTADDGGRSKLGKNLDLERAVALGASYGGYMVNWIQGHPLGRKFKALVCHDGVFSTLNQYASEELFFPIHDFGGTLWENREGYEKWDPARFAGEWKTPQLVIHSELDYRLPISEGLAAFNVLQSRGVPSKLLMFPDENHWVLKPENSLVWHKEVLAWINQYSGVNSAGSNDNKKEVRA